jgi:hypothetical protein
MGSGSSTTSPPILQRGKLREHLIQHPVCLGDKFVITLTIAFEVFLAVCKVVADLADAAHEESFHILDGPRVGPLSSREVLLRRGIYQRRRFPRGHNFFEEILFERFGQGAPVCLCAVLVAWIPTTLHGVFNARKVFQERGRFRWPLPSIVFCRLFGHRQIL